MVFINFTNHFYINFYYDKNKWNYAASMSVLNRDLSLNIEKTIDHAEKLIDEGCHGTAIFGSTGQSQLIPISEKIDLLNNFLKVNIKINI